MLPGGATGERKQGMLAERGQHLRPSGTDCPKGSGLRTKAGPILLALEGLLSPSLLHVLFVLCTLASRSCPLWGGGLIFLPPSQPSPLRGGPGCALAHQVHCGPHAPIQASGDVRGEPGVGGLLCPLPIPLPTFKAEGAPGNKQWYPF